MARKKQIKRVGALKGLEIDEVSMVGQGANQPAFVSIIKTAGGEEEIAKRMFEEVYQEILEEDKEWKWLDELFITNQALRWSVGSIVHDDKIENKKQKIFETLQQFVQVFASMVNDTDVIKSAEAILAIGDKEETKPEVEEKMEKAIAVLTLMASLNDVQKGVFGKMDEKGQEVVISKVFTDDKLDITVMNALLKAEPIKKEDDESFEFDGQTITKSEVGNASFLMMKGLSTRLEKSEVETVAARKFAKEEQDKRLLKEFSDNAEKRWPNLPGTPVEKGETLKAIMDLPEAIQKSQLAMLDAGNTGNSTLFKEHGHSNASEGNDPNTKLDSLAKAHAEKHSVDFSKAYSAVLETAEGKDLYEQGLK